MPRLIRAPSIQYTCSACKAISEADPDEFQDLHTIPPTFKIECAFCRLSVICSPVAMIAKTVGKISLESSITYLLGRL